MGEKRRRGRMLNAVVFHFRDPTNFAQILTHEIKCKKADLAEHLFYDWFLGVYRHDTIYIVKVERA